MDDKRTTPPPFKRRLGISYVDRLPDHLPLRERGVVWFRDWLEESTQHHWKSTFLWMVGGIAAYWAIGLWEPVENMSAIGQIALAFVGGFIFVALFYAVQVPKARLRRENEHYRKQIDRLVGVYREVDWYRDFRWYRLEVAMPLWSVVHEMWSVFTHEEDIDEDLNSVLDRVGIRYLGTPRSILDDFIRRVYPDDCRTARSCYEVGGWQAAGIPWEDYKQLDVCRTLAKEYFRDLYKLRDEAFEGYDAFLRNTVAKYHYRTGALLFHFENRRHGSFIGGGRTSILGAPWYEMVRWMWSKGRKS